MAYYMSAEDMIPTEFDIQFIAANSITAGGYNVKGEMTFKSRYSGQKDCRFDLVVFDNSQRILCVIECKRDNAPDAKDQIEYYASQLPGLLVIEVRGMKDALRALEKVESALSVSKRMDRAVKPNKLEPGQDIRYISPNYGTR